MFSKPCQYAILAMTYLAEQPSAGLLSIREISRRSHVPQPFLSKIMSNLSRHGLVSSRRGPKGGVALRGAPSDVRVGDIVEAIDGPIHHGFCVLGFDVCSDDVPCPMHESWKTARENLQNTLHRRTLADLTEARKKKLGTNGRSGPRGKRLG